MKKIAFGTGGFRGIIGDDFNKENIQIIAQALSNYYHGHDFNKPIYIGYDNRFMSDSAALYIAEVLCANKIQCFISHRSVPTPLVMSATRDKESELGIMITASHNPYYFNGIKVFTKEGRDADIEFTTELEKYIDDVDDVNAYTEEEAKDSGLLGTFNHVDEYVQHIIKLINPKVRNNNLKVLYNNLNGVGYVGLEIIASAMNLKKFDIMKRDHDAFFSFDLPNPCIDVMKKDFAKQVVEGHYDIGIGIDSDGDRLGIIDEKGNYISANQILAALYYYYIKVKGEKGDIVKNITTSKLLDHVAEHLGYKCHEVDVGFKNITNGMKKFDALMGGESSGGLTVRNYLFGKDAAFSTTMFLEMMIILGKPASQIIEEIQKEVGFTKNYLEFNKELSRSPFDLVDYITAHPPVTSIPYNSWIHKDRNFKYYYDNENWVVIRLSGTEPALRIVAEFDNEETTNSVVKEFCEYIDKVQLALK